MIQEVNILVVEDNNDQWQTYQDAANDFNNAEITINLERQINSADALSALLSNNYDGAIVDLNLSSGEPNEASGNVVLETITEGHRFPVLVVSGNLGNLNPNVKQSAFLKTFSRETPNAEIFAYLLKIHSTGITRILGGRGQIEKRLGDIFWRHLACDFINWDAGNRDSEKTLLRYTVAHLSEYLDVPDGEDDKFYHEAEFYIKPPIRNYIATGDIVESEGVRYIVLSPACDVAVRSEAENKPIINAERILLAPLIPISRAQLLGKGIIKEADNSERRKKIIEEIIKGQREKYAFLPVHGNLYSAIIDLQNIYTWDLDKFLGAQRIATVSGMFLKDIQSKFSGYYGRQGQPDLDKKKLIDKCAASLTPPQV
jgi:hypothetical protein